jgi:hypothetical protein
MVPRARPARDCRLADNRWHLATTIDVKGHEQAAAFLDLVERGRITTPLLERPALEWRVVENDTAPFTDPAASRLSRPRGRKVEDSRARSCRW